MGSNAADARHLAGMVTAGYITDSHAISALVDWARRDAGVLREAALTLRSEPDALPMAITLLDRAAEVAVFLCR